MNESELLRRIYARTETEVASKSGYCLSQISKISSGSAGIPIGSLEKFLGALDVQMIAREGELVTVTKDEYDALKLLAGRYLNKQEI